MATKSETHSETKHETRAAHDNHTSHSASKTTTDHDEIRAWVEKHSGKPSTVKRTGNGDDPGLLRINFPGGSGEDTLEEISWDKFFEQFEESKLAFLYQEHTADGKDSRFNKLISREPADEAHKKQSR